MCMFNVHVMFMKRLVGMKRTVGMRKRTVGMRREMSKKPLVLTMVTLQVKISRVDL